MTPPIIHGVNRNISESPSSPPLLHEREEIEQNDGTHGHSHPHGGDYGHGLASSLISRGKWLSLKYSLLFYETIVILYDNHSHSHSRVFKELLFLIWKFCEWFNDVLKQP